MPGCLAPHNTASGCCPCVTLSAPPLHFPQALHAPHPCRRRKPFMIVSTPEAAVGAVGQDRPADAPVGG
jgi:hypothetical protein